ncbi:MAG TPA: methylmalonyl Co-A mutase-associated GTPase MeaB [Candidatus Thermoplasmatota archaeon]|nr:methylmalonyl Co-A mutase-associated GTPase MeaB [Candidatus Thermoplasmatota archaeon]
MPAAQARTGPSSTPLESPPAASPAAGHRMPLGEAVAVGDRRALGRLITLLESEDPAGAAILQALHHRTGHAHVIGVTGSPGTGKSTLVDKLIEAYRRQGLKVGVVAVDPSSPYTGGAILGDRIRMQSRSTDPEVFIRSMGTRGALGGLARHTHDAVRALEAAGKQVILVETVGVGQAEVDVVQLADTVLVVLVPNLGDDVQAVKAGLMEIADLFVVNKSDLAGADKVQGDVEANLMLAHTALPAGAPAGTPPWTPPILRTVAERGEGVLALVDAVRAHAAWSKACGEWERRRARRLQEQVRALLVREVAGYAFARDGSVRPAFAPLLADVAAGRLSPQDASQRILQAFRKA